MVRVTDMTHGRPIRLILLFSLPLMLGSVFQQLYTIVRRRSSARAHTTGCVAYWL